MRNQATSVKYIFPLLGLEQAMGFENLLISLVLNVSQLLECILSFCAVSSGFYLSDYNSDFSMGKKKQTGCG